MKTCSRCKQSKDFSGFYKNKARYDGYCNYCKTCDNPNNLSAEENIRKNNKFEGGLNV